MSPALALALHVIAGLAIGWLAARAIRWWHAHRRAKARARLPEQMHLLGPHEPRWARRTLADIHQLPTTKGDR
ncbi:hypothetical protein ACWY4P_40615 [Streptomyces sp. LZ34]